MRTEFDGNHAKIMAKPSQEADEYIAKKYYEHVIQVMQKSIQHLKIQNAAEDLPTVSGNQLKPESMGEMSEFEPSEIRKFKIKLQIQFEYVEEAFSETRSVHLKVITKDSIEEQIEDFREKYSVNIEKLTDKLKRCTPTQAASSTMKLQEIKIPIFYGEMNQWSSFSDLFQGLVHNSKHFTEVEKMFRLKSSLGGEAGRLVQHLPVIEYNYEAAWQILQERYENKRLQFTTQVDRLLDQPTANGKSAASMKQLLDTTKECIYALNGLKLNLNDEQAIIARIVVRKLDKESLRLYEQNVKKTRDIQSLDDVFRFLEQQYQALEAIRDRKTTKWSNQKQPQRAPTFFTAAQKTCIYCKIPGHQIVECRRFQALTTMNRRGFIVNNKLCNICLDQVYEGNCKNKKKCTTAQIRVKAANGEYVTLRALIDQGSQKTTISEEAAQTVHLPKRREVTELQGLGNTTVGVSKFKVNIEIRLRFLSNEVYNVEALILPKLASAQPDKTFKWDIEQWRNYTLADPNFNRSDRIDVVIGGDVYADILEEGIFKEDRILGQATKLGWILSGVLQQPRKNGRILAAVTTTLEKFWEIEDTTAPTYIEDDDECMKIFDKTTTRDENNRFVVNLPFKKEKELGDSRKQAIARFLNLEKKLASDDNLRKQYVQFMRDYLEMGHMKKASGNNCGTYYLPHQAVIREGSLTTKLRVVFDASAKTTNGSDIEKMYRQIKVAESDQDYQRILWREAKEGPIGECKLQTVTYGTASAPFLATRTLQEIAKSCEPYNYLLSNIIKNDFYMDDLMTGAD
ncbi:uncharacterized protein LOC118745796 [Rhagoletis pomonella]|uniref:uncharacterized protein LOC118745796 n=1 Tax=Rhagoletis pomonella TaxID=28610 RepID=UPI001786561A|nr:uncharacterized protein LOC118745796 [Rhagoletis pomonella]